MSPELKQFIQSNKNLINQNTKESWEEIYQKVPMNVIGEFTRTILKADINDPAMAMGYIPEAYLCKSKIENYVIPDNVTSIDDFAFEDCRNLTSIVIPDSVTSIGSSAFYNCSKLTSVVIPDSVTSIGDRAFEWCDSLTEVVIPNRVTWEWIGEYIFSGCTNLKEIQFKGTQKEALDMLEDMDEIWREGSFIQKIICTDGIIEL